MKHRRLIRSAARLNGKKVDPNITAHIDTTARTTALAINDLEFGYEPGQPIVCGVTATLQKGQMCALIGPNAAGKSTLLRLMTGLIEPWAGTVTMDDHDVSQLPLHQRAAWISYVPQRAVASFAFTVGQVVEMGRHVLTTNPDAVERAIELCQLSPYRHRVYAHLSVGQQQRVLLARALAQATDQGKVMMLDEPASAMDLLHIHHTMQTLQNLARSGLAVLVVLHDLNLAARYADTVWLMNQGQITAAGPWESVLAPKILEPVYRVGLKTLKCNGHDRPIFTVDVDRQPID